jgi:MFS family permease
MPTQPDQAQGNNPNVIATIRRAILLVSLPFGILSFVLPIYGKRLGASALEIGGLFSAFALMTVLLRPLVGWALDRYGRRPFFLTAILGYAVTMTLFAAAQTMSLLYIARIVQGIGSSLLWLSAYAMVADLAPSNARGGGMGSVDGASNSGTLLGALFGFGALGTLGLNSGWPLLFASYALCALLAWWMVWRGVGETRPQAAGKPSDKQTAISPQLWTLMAIVIITSAGYAMVGPIVMIFLQDRFSTDVMTLATAFLPAAIIYSVLLVYMGQWGDRVGRRLPMAIGLTMAAIVSIATPNVPNIVWLIILWAAEALCFTAATPAEEALVADLSGEHARGAAYGRYMLAYGIGSTIGPLVGGWLYDQVPAYPFYVNAAALFIGAALILLLVREPKKLAS